MKYSEVIPQLPRLFRKEDAENYCAAPAFFAILCNEYGLKPIHRNPRMVIYDKLDIDAAIELLKLKTGK